MYTSKASTLTIKKTLFARSMRAVYLGFIFATFKMKVIGHFFFFINFDRISFRCRLYWLAHVYVILKLRSRSDHTLCPDISTAYVFCFYLRTAMNSLEFFQPRFFSFSFFWSALLQRFCQYNAASWISSWIRSLISFSCLGPILAVASLLEYKFCGKFFMYVA